MRWGWREGVGREDRRETERIGSDHRFRIDRSVSPTQIDLLEWSFGWRTSKWLPQRLIERQFVTMARNHLDERSSGSCVDQSNFLSLVNCRHRKCDVHSHNNKSRKVITAQGFRLTGCTYHLTSNMKTIMFLSAI